MKERTKAYMAGLVDAEGCISVNENVKVDKVSYQPVVTISNKSKNLMKWIVVNFGGDFTPKEWRHENGQIYKGYDWRIYNQKHIFRFLTLIYPYLILKRKQAESMLEYVTVAGKNCINRRQRLFKRISDLKQDCVTTGTLNSCFLNDKTWNPYIAGFFDGEGSCIIKDKHGWYQSSISLGNTQLVVIKEIKKRFSGNYYPFTKDNGETAYSYQIGAKKQQEIFLLAMLPYLIVKRPKAELLLDFVRLNGVCPDIRRKFFEQSEQLKIQSELHSDVQSGSAGTQISKTKL